MAYIDTSVLVAYYCPEPLSKAAEKAIRSAAPPVISPLVEVELYSALAMKVRTCQIEKDSARSVLACFKMHCSDGVYTTVAIGTREYTAACGWISAFSTPLRTVDALHLAAAFANDQTLLTSDKRLARAAKHFGVACKRVS
jgi:predicted nucleic acid-binding protein